VNHRLVFVYLAAEPMHQHIHDIGLRIKTVIENVFEDHRLRHWPIGVAHQVFEKRKLSRLQFYLLTPRRTSRDNRSIVKSPTASFVVSGVCEALRINAWIRAASSEKANGFVR